MAIGAIAALIVSPVFTEYSTQATSDVFFFAVYSLSLLLVLLGSKKRSGLIWMLGGLLIALTTLTRTNGFVLLPLLLFPWLSEKSSELNRAVRRSKWFGWMLIAFLLVMAGWGTFATWLDSPIWPTKTYESFALTYYSPNADRHSGDNLRVSSEQFDSTWEIISYDPMHIAKTYLSDLLLLARKIFAANHTIIFPVGLLGLLGVLSTFFPSRRPFEFIRSQRFFILYLLLTLAHLFGVNFRAFHERFYLFLIPLFGALVALGLQNAFAITRRKLIRYVIISSILIIVTYGVTISVRRAYDAAHRNDVELSQVVPVLNDLRIDPESKIITRKPHIPFYANSQQIFFPNVNSLDELQNAIAADTSRLYPVYLYYGGVEKLARPQFQQLRFPENSPPWLVPVAGDEKRGWVLYQVELNNDN